ncbi:hypothetical protein E2320_012938 [Naja naja]|nr:hypothetical protein E2320_012938 [Naja naja]
MDLAGVAQRNCGASQMHGRIKGFFPFFSSHASDYEENVQSLSEVSFLEATTHPGNIFFPPCQLSLQHASSLENIESGLMEAKEEKGDISLPIPDDQTGICCRGLTRNSSSVVHDIRPPTLANPPKQMKEDMSLTRSREKLVKFPSQTEKDLESHQIETVEHGTATEEVTLTIKLKT